MTPQEQKGESAPNRAAAVIMMAWRPLKTLAICWSAPVALAVAAMTTEKVRNGAIEASAPRVKLKLAPAWAGTVSASAAMMPSAVSTTRSARLSVPPMWRRAIVTSVISAPFLA